jgi:hypothetical protein
MTAFTIDIHEFYNELKEAGFTEKQADVIAKIQGRTANATVEQVKHDLHLDELATKRDIRETELRIITQLSTMQQDIQVTKLTNRALLAVGTVIAGALIKLAFF